jgi:hypothetical protein
MPHTTEHRILWTCLTFKNKYQLLQHATAQDKEVCYIFFSDFLPRIDENELFTAKIAFSDDATFHLSGNVNQHNLRIWGRNNPHKVTEHKRQSKANVFCVLSKQNVFGPFSLPT